MVKRKKFEPVYYKKETALSRLKSGSYGAKSIKKVKGNFNFRSKGKNIKRKTGYKLIGGYL